MRRGVFVAMIVVALWGVAFAACGGDDGTQAVTGTPVLRSSPIPPVSPVASPTAVCDTPALASMPANFPADVPVPPEYKVDSVETAPYLKVVGRASPPPGGPAYAVVFEELQRRLIESGWRPTLDPEGEGVRINFVREDDGRSGFFRVVPVADCQREVTLSYELSWVTP
jgi:hypothetical protein